MLVVRGLRVTYPAADAAEGRVSVLDELDLEVGDGEVVTVLGPSGCGKSTLLRAVAGLVEPDAGQIELGGRDLTGMPPHRRGIGLMFQDYALFPHRDVGDNVAFGLRMRGDRAADRDARVGELLALVGLGGAERRAVSTLSGGERQRVALARALAPSPELLMLDEPLGALDRTLRDRLVVELRELFAEVGVGVLYVTHDQTEALGLGHRVVVMEDGRAAQVGPPAELWTRPATPFVARFLGFANLVDAEGRHGVAQAPWGPVPAAGIEDGPVVLLVRPEAVTLGPEAEAGVGPVGMARVDDVVFQGGQWRVALRFGDLSLETTVAGGWNGAVRPPMATGATVSVRIDPAGVHALGRGARRRSGA